MSQTTILDNFSHFLDICIKELESDSLLQLEKLTDQQDIQQLITQTKNNIEYIYQLKIKLKKGHCYGFGVCHGAMDLQGKLKWWEHVLMEVNNWDRINSSLQEILTIPDSDSNKTITRRKLFELAMNYILLCHAEYGGGFYETIFPLHIGQLTLLRSINSHKTNRRKINFEMLNNKGEVQTVAKRQFIAGHFTKKSLLLLLDKQSIQGTLCLVHSDDHTIRIGYEGKNWIFYDSNDDHSGPAPIHVVFRTKRQLVKKIFSDLQTQSLCVEIAAFDANKQINFAAYDQFIKHNLLTRLKDRGLHFIAMYDDQLLLKLFNLAKETPNDKLIRSAITETMVKKTSDNFTCIHFISRYVPNALPSLLWLADRTVEGLALLTAITKTLTMQDNENWNGLHVIARYSPESLPALCALVDETQEGLALRSAIIKALSQKLTKINWNPLRILVEVFPEYVSLVLGTLFQCKQSNYPALCSILEALIAPDSNKKSVWEILLNSSPLSSAQILNMLVTELKKLSIIQLMRVKKQIMQTSFKSDVGTYPSFFNDKDSRTCLQKSIIININTILLLKCSEKKNNEEKTTMSLRF